VAARLKADAAAQRVSPGGALPDPQLAFGLRNRPLNGFGTDERMTMNVLQLSQRFPWPGNLGSSEERMRYLAEAERLEVDEADSRLVARVKSTYLEVAYIDRAISIMEETRWLLEEFRQVSSTQYEVGQGVQQDVLQAQVSVARMTEDIIVMEQSRAATASRLNALLGKPATMPVGIMELPTGFPDLPSPDSLAERAMAQRPALQAVRARARAAESGYQAARKSSYPDLTVMLEYGQRPQYADMMSVMVGLSLPVWSGRKQGPNQQAMLATQAMQEAAELDLYNETYARLTELSAEAERARSLVELYGTSILPQARAAVESALSAYRVGQVDFMTLVTNELTVHQYELAIVRLTADYHQALAEVESLLGHELEVAP